LENNSKKHILILCYTFPPFPGIGGRRWAKFAKYLAKLGYVVHVISAKNPHNGTSLFVNDIQHQNIKIHLFRSCFPKILINVIPNSFFEKIQYKFWMKILPLFVKGYVYDKAIFDKKKITILAEKIIKKYDIKNVIVTGAPFRLNYYFLRLKKQFPKINLIQDFRDPWTWGNSYRNLSIERGKYELNMQNQVVDQSNFITVPVDVMKNYLIETYSAYTNKFSVLPHAFDLDEIIIKNEYRINSFRCVLYGSIYSDIDDYFEKICKIIASCRGKLTLDIFSENQKYNHIVNNYGVNHWVKYKDSINSNLIYQKLTQYDYVIFIYPFYVKDFISTKFYEIISCKIPIIFIGEDGVISDFITSNNLGVHFNNKTLINDFNKLLNGEIQINYNSKYDVNCYSFKNITQKLISLFE
jgi:hypothetical protein